jgi:hypothetical protein
MPTHGRRARLPSAPAPITTSVRTQEPCSRTWLRTNPGPPASVDGHGVCRERVCFPPACQPAKLQKKKEKPSNTREIQMSIRSDVIVPTEPTEPGPQPPTRCDRKTHPRAQKANADARGDISSKPNSAGYTRKGLDSQRVRGVVREEKAFCSQME